MLLADAVISILAVCQSQDLKDIAGLLLAIASGRGHTVEPKMRNTL